MAKETALRSISYSYCSPDNYSPVLQKLGEQNQLSGRKLFLVCAISPISSQLYPKKSWTSRHFSLIGRNLGYFSLSTYIPSHPACYLPKSLVMSLSERLLVVDVLYEVDTHLQIFDPLVFVHNSVVQNIHMRVGSTKYFLSDECQLTAGATWVPLDRDSIFSQY